jgi:hypothetical protein
VLVPIDVGARAEGAELFITYPRDHGASAKSAHWPTACSGASATHPTGTGWPVRLIFGGVMARLGPTSDRRLL